MYTKKWKTLLRKNNEIVRLLESKIETQLLSECIIKVASNTNRCVRVIFCFTKFPGFKHFAGTRIILKRLDNDYYYSKKKCQNS